MTGHKNTSSCADNAETGIAHLPIHLTAILCQLALHDDLAKSALLDNLHQLEISPVAHPRMNPADMADALKILLAHVIHLDPWWNPAVEDQASDRAHRMGQERPVTVYRLVMGDTIEEQMIVLHGRKRQLAEDLLAGSDGVGRLDTHALLAVLRGDPK